MGKRKKQRGGILGEFPDPNDVTGFVRAGHMYELSRVSIFGEEALESFAVPIYDKTWQEVATSTLSPSGWIRPGDQFLVIDDSEFDANILIVLCKGVSGWCRITEWELGRIMRRSSPAESDT